MIREHEVPEGSDRCKHCGLLKPGPDSTCIVRDGAASEAPRPEPARRVMACEDDSIAERIAELRKQQEAAWNTEAAALTPPAPPPAIYKPGQP
jgi:hypothetical protein